MRWSTALSWTVVAAMAIACKRNGRDRAQHPEALGPQAAQNNAADAQSAAANTAQTNGAQPTVATNPCDAVFYRAPAGDSIQSITQTTAMLLWRERRGILGWPKPNGPVRVLLANDRVKALTADEQYLYFAQENGERNGVFRVPIAGGEPERMAAIGGMFGLIDDLKSTSTHLIMSRGMGELVRISKSPPFAQQVYSRRDQRRNGFGDWAVSEHAAWFGRPSRGLNDAGWVRLDFETGALTAIEGPIARIYAEGTSALVVRGRAALRVTTDAREREQKLFVVNEATGAVEAAPWWTGEPGFGFAIDGPRVAFSTTVETPENAMPVLGWLHGTLGGPPPQRFVTCPRGTSMVRAALRSMFDGNSVFVQVADNNNQHMLMRVRQGS
ncbi:MAG: hypothetical protein U0269_32640 [Polyangiales bacterium]